jgi:hypothetical protein
MTTPPAPTYPPTTDGLTAALAALGDSATQVAQRLTIAGHRGYRGECDRCPVATYLHATITGATQVHVGPDRAAVWSHSTGAAPVTAVLPVPVVVFVTAFDRGYWPHLTIQDDSGSVADG